MPNALPNPIEYAIWNPTGNITAIVKSDVPQSLHAEVAIAILKKHPEIEQVGYLSFREDDLPTLQMAGGEFCGNATMSAAAQTLQNRKETVPEMVPQLLHIQVSGAREKVAVQLQRRRDETYMASVLVPRALEQMEIEFTYAGVKEILPVIWMQGICHVIITKESAFYVMLDNQKVAERAIREWCTTLNVEGLGLIFLDEKDTDSWMTPLVYIPTIDTVFWEHSCASGSAAVGMYLAQRKASLCIMNLHEPGGILKVKSEPVSGETWLYGRTRLVGEYTLE